MAATKEYPEVKLSEIVAEGNVRELDATSPAFKELVASVKAQGVIEPVILAPLDEGGYVLVAGFRRVAAAKEAKLLTVPARVMNLTPTQRAEVQLIENLTRADLTPMEEARGIHAYSELAGAKPKEVAVKIGKSETYVRERLKLLNLIPEHQKRLESGKLSAKSAILLAGSPALVQGLYTDGYRETYNDYQLASDVPRMTKEYETAAALGEKYKDAKAPKCPECGSPIWERSPYGGKDAVRDARNHAWDPVTGKKVKIAESLGGYTRQAKRPAQEVDRSETPAGRIAPSAHAVATAMLAEIGEDGIKEVVVADGEVRIRVKKDLIDVREVVYLIPVAYSTGHRTQAVAHYANAQLRARDRDRVVEWAEKNAAARLGKAATGYTPVDAAKILDGTTDEVEKRLKKLGREELEDLREAECDGKDRGGVLDAIDYELGASSPGRYQRE